MAQNWAKQVLTALIADEVQDSCINMAFPKKEEHPFFWMTKEVLSFVQRSASFLHKYPDNGDDLYNVFSDTHVSLSPINKDYRVIYDLITKTKSKTNLNLINHEITYRALLWQIRNKVSYK